MLRVKSTTSFIKYAAVQASQNQCPVTKFYDKFPDIGGFYDSPYRWKKWMTEQIALCDSKLEHTPQQ